MVGRNVFNPVDRSSIPIGVASSHDEVVNLPPTVLENLTPDNFLNQDILIKDIRLNWNTTTVDVTVAGVKGEVYTIKISGGNGPDGIRTGDIMFEEQLFFQYSEVYTPLRLVLEEGMEYIFTLFDYHNTPQSTYTFIAPTDFTYIEMEPALESSAFEVVTSEPPTYLDKTSDSLSVFNVVLIITIVTVAALAVLRKKYTGSCK